VAQTVVPAHERWEKDGRWDRSLFIEAGKLGLLGFSVPQQLGGPGVKDFRYNAIVTAAPFRTTISAGIVAGVFRNVDVDLTVFDIILLGHGWALKHWHFGPIYTVDEYIALQTSQMLNSLISPDRRSDYAHLLG
jgi:hypothetical protein